MPLTFLNGIEFVRSMTVMNLSQGHRHKISLQASTVSSSFFYQFECGSMFFSYIKSSSFQKTLYQKIIAMYIINKRNQYKRKRREKKDMMRIYMITNGKYIFVSSDPLQFARIS